MTNIIKKLGLIINNKFFGYRNQAPYSIKLPTNRIAGQSGMWKQITKKHKWFWVKKYMISNTILDQITRDTGILPPYKDDFILEQNKLNGYFLNYLIKKTKRRPEGVKKLLTKEIKNNVLRN